MFDFTREKTISSVEQSLERLGVEYIDLIQVENQKLCRKHFAQMYLFIGS